MYRERVFSKIIWTVTVFFDGGISNESFVN